jgi:hypothetical protein
MFADIFPSTIDENGIVVVMIAFTAALLLVVGAGIWFFAKWSVKEKNRREKDVNTALNLKG